MSGREAFEIAREKDLDLIEVAPNANPPVCRIMDYGRYKYEQSKRERETRKKSKTTEVKGVRIKSSRIDDHDYEVRVRDSIKFLKEGDKVKVTVIFRSREINHPEIARQLLEKMVNDTAEFGAVEKPPAMEGRTMTLILTPKPQAAEKPERKEPVAKKEPTEPKAVAENAAS
jgi:translation initiation factor IF-3